MRLRGDCHVHTRRSFDARLWPADVVAEADSAGLDFVVVAEHDAETDPQDWAGAGSLLVVPAREVLSAAGHWLEIGPLPHRGPLGSGRPTGPRPLGPGAMSVAAHPFAPYPTGSFLHPLDGVDAVEVWNGAWTSSRPWQADNARALSAWTELLRRGRRAAAIGGSDAHLPGQLGLPTTVVRASERTVGSVVEALRNGRSWVSGSRDLLLDLSVTTPSGLAGPGGSASTAGGGTVRIDVEGAPPGSVVLLDQSGPLHVEPIAGSGTLTRTLDLVRAATRSELLRVEVRRPDGAVVALTNPVRIDPSSG